MGRDHLLMLYSFKKIQVFLDNQQNRGTMLHREN